MKNGTQGFTLIELLIVIAIIGILAAVLIPNLLGAQKRAYDVASLNCAKQIQTAETAAQGDFQTFVNNTTTDTATITGSGKSLDMDLISNCNSPVQFKEAKPDNQTDAVAAADRKIAVSGTGSTNTYVAYVWNTKGSKIYKVTPTSVQAQ